MPNLRLTEISVRALKGSGKNVSYWCDLTPGFCVRVGKRTKTFCVVRGRTRERLSIGKWPDLSVSDARAEAKRLLSSEPETKAIAITFAQAREQFVEENYRERKPRTKAEAKRILEKHFRHLTKMVLSDVTDADIKKALDTLTATPSEQLHAFRTLRCFFRWCLKPPRRFIKHSPMEGYEPPGSDRRGTRILTDAELLAVWEAAGEGQHAVIRLMALWGTRNTETTLLERSWVADGVLTIPGEHTKNGRDHAIPICPLAQSILDGCRDSNQYFFRGRWEGHLTFSGLAKLKKEVMEASGTSGWQTRDLRRTFRSNMARFKVPREICEILINHAPPVLDDIYDRYDRIAEKREALAKYEAALVWSLATA